MSVKALAAQRRDGRLISLGKIEHPAGTSTRSSVPSSSHFETVAKLSQYSRAEEAPAALSQYIMTLSRISSRVRTFSGWPSQSVHDQSFSTIHPHSAAGGRRGPGPQGRGRGA